MGYRTIVEMAQSTSLIERITAAAAEEGKNLPETWARENVWHIVASPGWDDAWEYAVNTRTINQNPDTGARDDVINDQMILAAVQSVAQPM